MDTPEQPRRGPGRPSNSEKAERTAMQSRASDAINHPVNSGSNVNFESAEYVPDFDDVVDYSHLKFAIVKPQLVVTGEREFKDLAEQEAFMQDRLVIMIHRSGDKRQPRLVPAGLNGDQVFLPRGVKVRVPRGIVGSLLQSQETEFTTEDVADPNADQGKRVVAHNVPCYPLNILYDPNPRKGAAWVRRITSEGC